MIRVVVAAPSLALRVGLREVLGELLDVEVVAESARVEDALRHDADLLVATSLDGLEGETLPPILLLTDDPDEVRALLRLDVPAWGALPLNASETELDAAIRALGEGLTVGSPALLDGLFHQPAAFDLADNDPLPDPPTARELEVLQLMSQGLANKQIAFAMGISEHTVKFHLSSLYAKLGVTSRTEAVRAGARRGLIVL